MSESTKKAALSIEPLILQNFLRTRGWTEESDFPTFRVFQNKHVKGRVSIVAPKQKLADYAERISDAVTILSQFNEVDDLDILAQLLSPDADLISFRYTGPSSKTGTISIEDSIRFRKARRDMLLAVAHTVEEPSPYYPRMARRRAVEFLRQCKEAPPIKGSYISEIIIPVPRPIVPDLEDDHRNRRITRMLSRALSTAFKYVDNGMEEGLIRSPKLGLSSNFLKALSNLRPPGESGEIEISFNWSGSRRPPKNGLKKISFSSPSFERFRVASRVLRNTSEVPQYELEGYVTRLAREKGEEEGYITVAGKIGDDLRTVGVRLGGEEYERALEAHKNDRQVRVIGTLKRDGRTFNLMNASEIVVIATSDSEEKLETPRFNFS